jgi:hypothetical protein
MYCPKCGTENDDNAFRCIKCSEIIQPVPPAATVTTMALEDEPGIRLVLPVGRSGWAIAAGYAGLFALIIFPAPIALILGIIAVIDIKKHPERHGMGRAVFAIIMGALFSVPLVLILIAILST